MPLSRNRTLWPVNGGAVSVQPGWFPGHSKAFIYMNIGINRPGEEAPPNMSHPVVPPFQLLGPSNLEYPGQFCLPQVGMPANLSLQVGDNITLQVIETAQHGAALYNVSRATSKVNLALADADISFGQCVDLTLAEPEDVEEVTPQNCYNSSDLDFNLVFTTEALRNAAPSSFSSSSTFLFVALASVAILIL